MNRSGARKKGGGSGGTLGLTASCLIRALSPRALQPSLELHADRLAARLKADLRRRGAEAIATVSSRDGETTIALIGPDLWRREYGSLDEPARGDVADALNTVNGER